MIPFIPLPVYPLLDCTHIAAHQTQCDMCQRLVCINCIILRGIGFFGFKRFCVGCDRQETIVQHNNQINKTQ